MNWLNLNQNWIHTFETIYLTEKTAASMINILVSHNGESCDLEKFWKIKSQIILPETKDQTQTKYLDIYMHLLENIIYDSLKYTAKRQSQTTAIKSRSSLIKRL